MPQASKTFRIFVSSTFSDLKEERNALQKYVFPRLRELCMQHGCRFQAIDLRWGVSEEASLDQQTMKICLEEIARCQRVTPRPNFIVLLGDRYGWRPLPAEIPSREFDHIESNVTNDDDLHLLRHWYQRDDNARYKRDDRADLESVYCLQPRSPESCFSDFQTWEREVERPLHAILLRGIEGLDLTADERRKYEASATEQEIEAGAMRVGDAHEHVYCFFRSIKTARDLPIAGELPQESVVNDFVDVVSEPGAAESVILDEDSRRRLGDLKQRLRARIPHNIHTYEAQWKDDAAYPHDADSSTTPISTDHIGALPESLDECLRLIDEPGETRLCLDVWRRLARVILDQVQELESLDPLDREIDDHRKFGEESAKFFTGRASYLEAISEYIKGDDAHPLAVYGESGSGKTALMARAVAAAVEYAKETHPSAVIVQRFIGATPSSSDGRALLEGLCKEIAEHYGEDEQSVSAEYQKLVKDFQKRLELATQDKPLIIFLDALDQLSDNEHARNLAWLPNKLPPHVHVIVSTLPGECLSHLEQKLPTDHLLKLDPMTSSEGDELLDRWLADAKRRLTSAQRESVLKEFMVNGLPLYLKLVFEEARRWKSYSLAQRFRADILAMIRAMFRRLMADHGQMLIERALGYIAAARHGLSEDELLDVLSMDEEVFDDFLEWALHKPPERRLPVVVWSRLYFDLEPYLTERSADGANLLGFYHRQLGEVVTEQFLGRTAKRERHRCLARYFQIQPLYIDREGSRTANYRKLSELPYQETQGEMWAELETTLTDFSIATAKTASGLVDELTVDYQLASERSPEELGRVMRIWRRFLEDRRHILRRGNLEWPAHKILLQLAIEHADNSPVTRAAETWVEQGRCDWVWFRRVPRSVHVALGSCLRVLEGQDRPVDGALELRNGTLLSWSEDAAGDYALRVWDGQSGDCVASLIGHTGYLRGALELRDGSVVSWSSDCTLRIWNAQSGHCTMSLQTNPVSGVLELQDGRLLSWSIDGTLRIWDLRTGACVASLVGHTDYLDAALELRDGRLLSWSNDNTLRIWNAQTGECLALLEGHTKAIHGALELRSGPLLSWSWDGTVRLWNSDTGECPIVLEGHSDGVVGVLELRNGQILSWSADKSLRIWESQTGVSIGTLLGHSGWGVIGAFELSDGRLLSWSSDNTVRLWNAETCECIAVLAGHTKLINGALELSSGRLLSWSRDKSLRLWDGNAGECLAILEGHEADVKGAVELREGHLLSWSPDETLRVWDPDSHRSSGSPIGHTEPVGGVIELRDGRLLTWSDDCTMRTWDPRTGHCIVTLEGHTSWISAATELSDGRLLSWADDHTLRIWDSRTAQCLALLEGHTEWVEEAVELRDGTILSWSRDKTLRRWDPHTAQCLALLEGHDAWLMGALELSDLHVLSWSQDRTLQIWDPRDSRCVALFEGHSDTVEGASELNDGRLLSWSWDNTLRIWDRQTGQCNRSLVGHNSRVEGALELSDGSLLSWSWDSTLRTWDSRTGECIFSFDGHEKSVQGALELANGLLLSSSLDQTLRIWEIRTARCLAVVTAHDRELLSEFQLKTGQSLFWGLSEMIKFEVGSETDIEVDRQRLNGARAHSRTVPDSLAVYQSVIFGWRDDRFCGISRLVANAPCLAAWHADGICTARILLNDGTLVASLTAGEVCFLKLYYAGGRVTLDELGRIT